MARSRASVLNSGKWEAGRWCCVEGAEGWRRQPVPCTSRANGSTLIL